MCALVSNVPMLAEHRQTVTRATGAEVSQMTMVEQGDKTAKKLTLVDLPPFPAVAIRALQLVSKTETRLSELHDLISADPAFATEILRLANSPLYGIRSSITSTVQATMLLGFERVKGVALTIAMRSYIGNSLHIPALRASWRHSLACAMVAEELVKVMSKNIDIDKDAAYTNGLIHDIGRLGLAVMQPEFYIPLVQKIQNSSADLLQSERELFGMDHCEAGRLMVTSWSLPDNFIDIVTRHHEARTVESFDSLALVSLSCRMTDALGFDFAPCADCLSYENLLRELPEQARVQMSKNPEELTARIEEKIACVEAVQGPKFSHFMPATPIPAQAGGKPLSRAVHMS
jgi:putative nucleotidyltransferase with HDIG domain